MKKNLLMLFGMLFFISKVFSQNETEPNNYFVQANSISLNDTIQETISVNNDIDFFKITLPRDGVVEVNITNLPCLHVFCSGGGLPIEFKVYAADSTTVIDSSSNASGGGNSAYQVNYPVLLEKGSYYIKIYSSGNAFSSSTAFNTAFNFDTTDLKETNNQFYKAAAVPLNTVFNEKIYGYNKTGAYMQSGNNSGIDVDFFKITLPRDGVVEVNITNLPCLDFFCRSGLPIEFKVYALDSTTVIDSSSNASGGGNYAFQINYPVLLERGSYYIKIYSINNGFSSPTAFNTAFNFDTTDLKETNNQFYKAAAVPLNTVFKEKIYGYNKTGAYKQSGNNAGRDVDFYKVTIPRKDTLKISITNLPCLDFFCRSGLPVEFKVYALDSTTVIDSSNNTSGGGDYAFQLNYSVPLDAGSYYIKIGSINNGFSSPTAFNTAFNINPAALPLKIIYFKAYAAGTANKVLWQTATEQNTSYFMVQRSADGISFNEIGRVPASGNSNSVKNYLYTDVDMPSPNTGVVYYRLQMVDNDGHFTYSIITAVKNNKDGNSLEVFPNPAKDNLVIRVENDKTETATIQLTDIEGRIVQQQSLTITKGTTSASINISKLTKGTYILVLRADTPQKQVIVKE